MQRRKYTTEYKLQAVELTSEPGVSISQVAKELGINDNVLRRWRKQYLEDPANAFPGKGSPRDKEMSDLKRELARVKKERDFLREAAAYFAKGPK